MKAMLIRNAVLCALATSALAGNAWAQTKTTAADAPALIINDQTGKEPGLIKSIPAPNPPRTKVEIYKQTLPNGQVVYGDAPVSGRKVDKVITVDVAPGQKVWSAEQDVTAPAAAPKPSYMTPKPSDPAKAAEAAQTTARIAAEIEAAEEAFRAAEKELQEGKAPVDGDRSRNVNGTTRLNEGYFARQKRLQEKMDAANNRLYQAYEAARLASR